MLSLSRMNNDAPLMSTWRRMKPYVFVFDPLLSIVLALLATFSLVTLYSAGYDFPGRFEGQVRNFIAAFVMMWFIANISPQRMMRFAIPVYVIGLLLLVAVLVAGTVKSGARRWLTVGPLQIQPSELLKIGVPLMLAWYFHRYETLIRWWHFIAAGVMLVVPVALIAKQPDLGTALLVMAAGIYVIYFAGLSWKLILPVLIAAVIGATVLIFVGDRICEPEVAWPGMHDYQKQRICTLLDPTTDPLGRGFHTIQSAIAVGSGGVTGKGYMKGTQTHLDFIPERTTDFILAVYAEEFGFVGIILLLCLYFSLIFRGLVIAANAPTYFARLLAGSITLIFFTYAFVNMGMVSGILPVVGVPLPFMSYGGTALVTLGIGAGILMSVQRNKKIVQT